MHQSRVQYGVDSAENPTAVLVLLDEWRRMPEELHDLRACDAAKLE